MFCEVIKKKFTDRSSQRLFFESW